MLATAASCLVVAIVLQAALAPRLSYPPSQKGDVVDDYFGTRVADPYRWMEDLDSKDVAEWVAAQNQVTSSYLATLPLRAHFERRIAALWDYPKVTLPVKEGGRYFYQKNSGLERQAPLYVRDTLNAPARVVLDPNQLSPDGSVSLTQWEPSRDGRLVAYALSEGGADWRTVRVRRVDEGTDLADEVRRVRFSAIAWTNDGRGFFYSRYPEPPKGKVLEAALANHALYYHRVGTAQAADTLVYARPDLPTWFLGGAVTEDGRYLIVSLARGAENTNRLYYADLGDPAAPNVGAVVTPLVEQDGAEFAVFGNAGPVLYLRTDRDAPNRAVVALDVRHPERARWRTVVAETRDAIESVLFVGNRIVIQYLADVQSRVSTFGVDGTPLGEVALPGTGTIAGLGGRQDDGELFYAFSSPLFPTTVFSYDLASKTPRPFEVARPAVDVDLYETRALFAPSKDGTRVPLFLTWRKGMALDGSHPTMLYGYGGFSVSMLPTYRTDVPAWLEQGGIWVT
ncbi:MAG: S9 family peptidase, partial [Acidobacteriota bacterium]